jgi:transcription initiation factor IIE alpha subunit
MGQQEVYDFLRKNKRRWFTSKEISKSLNISIGSITACLKKLRRTETIDFETTGNRNEFKYRYKESKDDDEETEKPKKTRKTAKKGKKR